MEKMGTLKKNGDQKTNFGPHGDQSPQMGTNVGAVLGSVSDESDNYLCCLVISLYLCFDIREKGPNAFQEFQSCLFSGATMNLDHKTGRCFSIFNSSCFGPSLLRSFFSLTSVV